MRWVVELDDVIRARHIENDNMQVAFALSNMTGRAKVWALRLKLHDPHVFGSLDTLKSRLKETFEPPRAMARSRSKHFRLKQGKRDVRGFAQHLLYFASSATEHPVDEYTLIDVFMNGLVDGPVNMLHKAIPYAVQEDFSLRQSQATKSTYLPVR